ncbi:MAG: peptidase Ste24p [Gemmatimonadetes bacterium]|nr:peptidase Ste24p [Gemmatimonadota bacterium]
MTRSIAALCVLLLAACAVDQDEEVRIGRQNAQAVGTQLPIVRDPVVAEYVQRFGTDLASRTSRADLQWRFFVVNSGDINAFALPGGFIYVNRGLIERAERFDELAGVLGHEIGHVVLRHSVEQMQKGSRTNVAVGVGCAVTGWCDNGLAQAAIQVGGAALFARYSRGDEAEADAEAVDIVMRAGIDPEGIPSFFTRLMEERRRSPVAFETFFASHPMEADRVAATRRQIDALDPARRRGLVSEDARYDAFRQRVMSLP